MKKERPILFSTEMVKAILEGRKTQTRRTKGLELINANPDDWQFEWADFALKQPYRFTKKSSVNEKSLSDRSFHQEAIACSYGKPGDILWVRETWDYGYPYAYKADGVAAIGKWRRSIHIPKKAARLWLEITSVRVERLNEISEQDARKEGVVRNYLVGFARGSEEWKNYSNDSMILNNATKSFMSLWESINGEDSWNTNPFVWVIEFKQIKKP